MKIKTQTHKPELKKLATLLKTTGLKVEFKSDAELDVETPGRRTQTYVQKTWQNLLNPFTPKEN